MSDRRRDQTAELPRSTRDELIASQRRLASRQHKTLPIGVEAVDDGPRPGPPPELSGGVHTPDRGPISTRDIHHALGQHLDLLADDVRDQVLAALGAHKYLLGSNILDSEVKRYPKNLSLARAGSAIRHYGIGRAEADLGALFVAPRLRRPPPQGLAPDVAQAVRLIDGTTPIEEIIRRTKLDRLKALDTFALLARTGFIEVPSVATPAPADLVLTPASAGPVERSRAASSDSVVRADGRADARDSSPPRSANASSGVRPSDRPRSAVTARDLPAASATVDAVRDVEPALLVVPDLEVAPSSRHAKLIAPASHEADPGDAPAISIESTTDEEDDDAPVIEARPISSAQPAVELAAPSSRPAAAPHDGVELGLRASMLPSRPGPRVPRLVALALACVAVGGLVAYSYSERAHRGADTGKLSRDAGGLNGALAPAEPGPTVAPTATATSVVPAPAMDTITVDIWAEPKFARVSIDGVLFTQSPIHVSIPRSEKVHEVTVEAPGFVTRKTTFVGKANSSLVLSLERAPRRSP